MITCDIPGAFMQVDMDELVHVKLKGKVTKLLIKVDPTYESVQTYEQGKLVIYTKLDEAL